jgi:RNA polymerase sigma-70 factor, ECF subfamily
LTNVAVRLEDLSSRNRVEETYVLYADVIWRFCFRLLLDRTAAEDVVECVFVHMAERWSILKDRDKSELRNWLYGEARNVVRSHLREENKQHEALYEIWLLGHGQFQGNPGPPAEIDPPLVYEAMQRLKAADRELIVLRFMENLTVKETASIVGKSQVAARVALLRVMGRLKSALRRMVKEQATRHAYR